MTVPEALIEAAYAVGIGLAVGFEREHHVVSHGLEPEEIPEEKSAAIAKATLGGRTFATLSLGGWLAAYVGDGYAAAVPLGLAGLVLFILAHYVVAVREGTADPGITTEVAAVVVVLLGMLVHTARGLAVPLALGLILLLISKPWMQKATVRLRRIEITATVQLLVLAAIVLPLLPAEPQDPWGAIPPQKVGIFVVAIAAVEYVGYVLHRLIGARRGIGLAGLLGGLVSSTAVTAAMSRRARENESTVAPGQAATFFANAVMGVRVAVLTSLLSREVAYRVIPAMVAFVAVLLVGAVVRLRASRGAPVDAEGVALRNPFALLPALTWGAILCAVLLATHFATEYLGGRGLLLAAAVSGLADVDAITLAAAREARDGALSADIAALAVAIAVAANTVVKGGIALSGGRRFGVGVVATFAAAIASAGVAAAIVLLV